MWMNVFMDALLYKVVRLCCTSLERERLCATQGYVTRLARNNILFHIFATMDIINNAIGEYQQMVGRFYILAMFYVVIVSTFQSLSIHFFYYHWNALRYEAYSSANHSNECADFKILFFSIIVNSHLENLNVSSL